MVSLYLWRLSASLSVFLVIFTGFFFGGIFASFFFVVFWVWVLALFFFFFLFRRAISLFISLISKSISVRPTELACCNKFNALFRSLFTPSP